ncbi:MAG: hypothetical protein PHG97_00760 [Candidatus Margulisbacteria bacterium]|nr:hypothetical protein [Candidatus Margulisiibacteriota bacterium]
MAVVQEKNSGPNFQALGFKSPMEVIDLLAMLKIDGEPIIKDDSALLDPKAKAQAIMQYFAEKHNMKPNDLPYIAAVIKQDLKAGRIKWGQ